MRFLLCVMAMSLVFFVGCNSKQYYNPKEIHGQIEPLEAPYRLISQTRQGITLKGGKVLNAQGISEYSLPQDCIFLNENHNSAMALCEYDETESPFKLLILDKTTLRQEYIPYDSKPLAASLQNNLLAVVLANNTLILQNRYDHTLLFEQKEKAVLSIGTLNANPIFLKELVVFPTLDGALVIVDMNRFNVVRKVDIANAEHFNNITYLDVFDNRLIVATKFKTVSVSPEYIHTYDINLRDILVLRDRIYLLSAEGEVIYSDHDLNIQKTLKFPFAHFLTMGVGEELVVLEERGYMIVLDVDLKDYRVYRVNEDIKYPAFGNNEAIYFGDFYIKIK